ncbi:MAG: membrane-bound lytic murein transglycosylase MltF [Gammaproteobacteria bacterium]|nr:membrane-bound lytic murein transglycosylase MltF [Gammaproteobacteria bacterium]
MVAGSLFLCLSVLLMACQPQSELNQLESIQQRGYIKVYTRIAPTTMYVGDGGFTGFEYELVKQFADFLEVDVQIITENDIGKMIQDLEKGRADIIAAGLTVTKERQKKIRFAPSYQEIVSKLVYKQGEKRPRDFAQIEDGLMVMANSSHSSILKSTKQLYPELTWDASSAYGSSELLEMVIDGSILYTIADSNDLDLARQIEPELAVAFSVSEAQQLAWALTKSSDDSFYAKTIEFFAHIRSNGTLDYLIERYYGHLKKFDYVDSREFHRAIESRLPELKSFFMQAAGSDLDWRFLAAMGYQESHWKADARSPTGVRGLMMLTQDTAKQMGIEDRLDAKQSIYGGADYFRLMQKKIPERITDPDRNWFALAGYNVGFGHLEDARRLAQGEGDNPDIWQVVKEYLPLLRQKKWYSKTRFGYARGNEPVRYVGNIRQYYAVLVQLFNLDGSSKFNKYLDVSELNCEEHQNKLTIRPAEGDVLTHTLFVNDDLLVEISQTDNWILENASCSKDGFVVEISQPQISENPIQRYQLVVSDGLVSVTNLPTN